ncbi:unnamed protein product [Adineta ricciae]|uniref:Uncharacterized protein n=1 Tax=Adineta ricciae TaxID=249248 RepID=A0A814SLC0_ADIRI|nr:unnamed protein product [Adineta ricciae]
MNVIKLNRFSSPALPNHPGRAALVSGPKRQSISHNIPVNNRLITSTTTTSSTPSFSNVEHARRYSLSRTHSEQPSKEGSESSTPSSSRRTSTSDTNEKSQRDSNISNYNVNAPKSLREWHEQPVNLSEQPPLSEKVNVQILSPNSDRSTTRFFVDNDLATLVIPNGESKSEEIHSMPSESTKDSSNENE